MDNNINTIKKNNDIQVDFSQELVIEVHVKHVKYIFMSWHVNVKEKIIKCRYSEYIFRSLETNKRTNHVHGKESFLKSYDFLCWSENSPHFVQCKGLLPFQKSRHFSAFWARWIQATPFHAVTTEALKGFMSIYNYIYIWTTVTDQNHM